MPTQAVTEYDSTTAAYHEAGHVVMAHLLGGVVVTTTLESDEEELGGLTTVRWHGQSEQDRVRCSALVAMAGPIAETRWRGDALTLDALIAWQGDWQEVQIALESQDDETDHAKLLHQWLAEVSRQFEDPVVWETLCRVADGLEAHLTLDDDLLDQVLDRD